MLIKLGLLFCFFFICSSFDIHVITNYADEKIKFTKDKKFFVYKYENTRKEFFELMFLKMWQNNEIYNIYIYLNSSNINESFINYYRAITFDKTICTLNIDELLSKKFYIVISQTNISSSDTLYVKIFSPDRYSIMNSTLLALGFYNENIIIKLAPYFNATYLKFGYHGGAAHYRYIEFKILKNDLIVYNKTGYLDYEDYFKVKNDSSYIINLQTNTEGRFYLILAENPYFLPVKINTENFQYFPVFSALNLSLDTSTIENKYRFKVHYRIAGALFFDVFGYNTDDYNEIENTQGIKLEKLEEEKGYNNNYNKSFYILKESPELKRVILKISAINSGSIQIKYGEQEFYYGHNVFMSVMIGLGLSIPNLLVQIFAKRSAPFFSFLMNIILHFAYGNLLSYPLHFGGSYSTIIGAISGALYLFLFCCCIYASCASPNKYIFNLLYYSLKDFEELPILGEILDENRKKPPTIKIYAKAGHKESREILKEYQPYKQELFSNELYVSPYGNASLIPHYEGTTINFQHVDSHLSEWKRVDEGGGKIEGKPGNSYNSFVKNVETRTVEVWEKDSEYKYASWQDCTKFNSEGSDFSIVTVSFDFELIFNSSGKTGNQKAIDELCQKGKSHDTDVYHKEEHLCYHFNREERCYFNKKEYNRVKAVHKEGYFFIGLILFILGYSSIIDCFTYYEEGEIKINIEKLISDEKDLRAEYGEEDKNLPSLENTGDEINLGLDEEQNNFEKTDYNYISKYNLFE